MRITNEGSGDCLVVEDSANPDSTPFVVTSDGSVGIGTTSPGSALEINAAAATSPFIAGINNSESARIDSSGRLLVGTSTARSVGQVTQPIQQESTSDTGIAFVRNSSGDILGSYVILAKSRGGSIGSNTVVQSGDQLGALVFAGADGTDVNTQAALIEAFVDTTPGANDMPGRLKFSTTPSGSSAPTERMRITNAGNVGIGTTSPGSLLHAKGLSAGAEVARFEAFDALTTTKLATFQRVGGAVEGAISFVPNLINFGTTTDHVLTFSTNNTERVRITTTGRVGINVTSPTFLLQLPNTATDAGGRGRANQWTTYSDGRIKTDREELPYGIDAVMQLKPLRYFHHNSTINEDGTIEILEEGEVSIGLVAEDVDNIIPEVVSVPEDLTKDLCSLDYSKLNTVLVKAIQEQQGMIAELQAKVAALEAV
jgi:hypothetical protein